MPDNTRLAESGRVHVVDMQCASDVSDHNFLNHLFVRLGAKGVSFINVDFRYSIFDTCYLRKCKFESCDFTGCRFIGTQLPGSSFFNCKFEYTSFERTAIDDAILDTQCPGGDNLKMRFARSLRVNYQQLGDAKSANKAIAVELQAEGEHLHKVWSSNDRYYHDKYTKWERLRYYFKWLEFRSLDFLWGNGESALKLLRSMLIALLSISALDGFWFKDRWNIHSYWRAIIESPQVFFGTLSPSNYPGLYLACIVFIRLAAFGLLISIIIKRFNRR